ncbi:phospholipase C type enzyme [Mortierella sp. AD010]|nr:phospholipase C type enzyme [Mortierella sp. AD010]
MERMTSSGSLKRSTSAHTNSSIGPASPIGSLSMSSLVHPEDAFSNNPEDYDIRLPIGYGSSAVVYNAYYKPLNKRIAIKVIDLDMFERNQIDELRRETQVMALCKHPNVLRVNGAFVTDSKLYIVTPYLSAGKYYAEIDVKAGNLLVDDDGSVLLADFGVSSSLMESGERRGMRKTFVGTPCWMAPEVMEQAEYDYKADIWSFGITAIELATGHAPFAKYPPIKAKKKSYLVSSLLHNLPPLEQRPPRKTEKKPPIPEKAVSWDFEGDESASAGQSTSPPDNDVSRRPRTVKFEPSPDRPLSTATTGSTENRTIDSLPGDTPSSHDSTTLPIHVGDKPARKSRFVIEDSVSASSPVISHATEILPSPSQPLPPVLSAQVPTHGVIQPGSMVGLGVSHGATDQVALPEVKKGRFSVKDTSLSVVSPVLPSIKIMPGDALMSPRSLSSSPIEGTSEGVRIVTPLVPHLPSERKSRFEVHHSHITPTSDSSTLTTGVGTNPPSQLAVPGAPLSREPPQPRVVSDTGLIRDISTTRVSRFSIEPNITHSEGPSTPVSVVTSSAGTPTHSSGLLATPSKRSRFQVSSVEGSRPVGDQGEGPGSIHSTPATSPTGSLLCGHPGLLDALGAQSVYSYLDTLYRQNEQQRVILTELFAGFGLKTGSLGKAHNEGGASSSAGSSGTVNRQEQSATFERQLQAAVRENESLRRENEALKRELDRLRRGGMGLKFVSKDRQDRLTAIGRYLADSSRGYDIVGLQEVWVYDDYLRIKELVQDTLPHTKHWHSGILGSGLVILSKYPIVSTTMRRFALNGDPFKFFHGDWYVGKCVVSATLAHPSCGEIEVFNTHLHAGYDPVGTPDSYLGCRVGEAWEMASLIKAATTQGRHVISLGDYNSAPNSLVVQLLTKHGGMTDSWIRVHSEPRDPIPTGLTPEEGVAIMGVTCDTPLNTWTKHTWLNYLTNDPVGERLDYIFYRETPEMVCTSVKVAVQEKISGIGKPNSGLKNYSDHFGVNATFSIKPAVYHFQDRRPGLESLDSSTTMGDTKDHGLSVDKLEEILLLLNHHNAAAKAHSKLELTTVFPLMLICTLGLIIAFFWISPRWVAFILALVLSALSSGWIVHFLYGFLYGGETASAYINTIQEVQTVLDYKLLGNQNASRSTATGISRASSSGRYDAQGVRLGLIQK